MDTEQRTYTYYAFISYKHTDKRWAKWIQHRLETYRFPVTIRSEHDSLPKKIFPIFRDDTDMAGGVIKEELKARLEESEYLIVLCSPDSAKSEWVEQEVSYFKSLGRGDRIVPLIISGEPFAQDPAQECLCPSLRDNSDEEMLGVSIPALGRRKAFLRVVATIMQLRFGELVRRDKRRTLRRRLAVGFVATVLVAAILGAHWYFSPHTRYYWSVTLRNSVPEGIVEISDAERKRADGFYKLVTQRGRIVRLELVNSLGKPTDFIISSMLNTYDCPIVEFAYAGDNLASATYMNALGEPQMVERYDGLDAMNLVNPQNSSMIGDTEFDDQDIPSAMGEIYRSDLQISRTLLTRDEEGFCAEQRHMRDNLNNPACDETGTYGSSFEVDDLGEITHITYLNREGEPLYEDAACAERVEYNARGQITSMSQLDGQDRPALKDGVHRTVFSYDENGNISSFQYYDAEGNPCCDIESGVQMIQFTHDERGLVSGIAYFDERGEAAYSKDEGVHRLVYQYDAQGNRIQEDYYDADGERMCNLNGIAGIRFAYDALGRKLEARYFGIDGEPAYWGVRGDPENVNQEVLEAGADQKPLYGCGMNSAGSREEYLDEHTIRTIYLDADGEPALCYHGYAMLQRSYNADGLLERLDFLDAEGAPIRAMYNAASILYGYNGASRLNAVDYLDESGAPCINMFGAAQERIDYDGNGRPIGIRYFDAEGNPCWVKGSETAFSQLRFEFTDLGKVSSIRYYDPDGKLLGNEYNFSEKRMQYDARGNLIRDSLHDALGNLTNNSESGIAVRESDYDSQGRLIQRRYLDENGAEPVGVTSWEEWEYNAWGENTRYTYSQRNASGERIQTSEIYAYDARGNKISTAYQDGDGEPVEVDGVAAFEYSYNEKNQLVRQAKFDANGNYASEGVAVVENTYDARGMICLQDELGLEDGSDALTYLRRGRAGHDQYGFQNVLQIMDSDGNLMPDSDGCAAWVFVFDAMGNRLESRWFDERGEPFANEHGYAEIRSAFDAMGNEIETAFYDVEGAPMARESGCPACIQTTYNALGYEESLATFDEDGKPFESPYFGNAKCVWAYDLNGINVYTEKYGEDEKIKSISVRLPDVLGIVEGSAAEEAGLKAGDVILALDDWSILECGGFRDVQLSPVLRAITESARESRRIVVCRSEEGEGGVSYRPLEFELGPGVAGIAIRGGLFDLYDAKCILEAGRTGQPATLSNEPSDYSDYQYERDGTF